MVSVPATLHAPGAPGKRPEGGGCTWIHPPLGLVLRESGPLSSRQPGGTCACAAARGYGTLRQPWPQGGPPEFGGRWGACGADGPLGSSSQHPKGVCMCTGQGPRTSMEASCVQGWAEEAGRQNEQVLWEVGRVLGVGWGGLDPAP